MAEGLSLEQQRAVAMANARLRMQQAPEPAQAAGSSPLPSYGKTLKSNVSDIGQGFMTGGPVGAATAGVGTALKNVGTLVDRGAYLAGGGITDALAPHVPPEVAGGAGFLTNVATQAAPTIAGAGVGKLAGGGLETLARKLMQSALKPGSKEIVSGDAARAVETLLKEGINVTPGGAVKLRAMIDDLSKQVEKEIAGSTATVSKAHPMSAVYETLQKFRNQVTPGADTKAILDAWQEFTQRFGNQIPVQQAQALKQGTYRVLEGKYGEVGSAATEAQKAMARGLKEGIEGAHPSVAPLNKRQSDLINALEQAEYRAAIAANRDVAGIAPAAMSPRAAATMLADRSPLVKSLLARALNSRLAGGGPLPTTAGALIGGSIGAESGRPDPEELARILMMRAQQ